MPYAHAHAALFWQAFGLNVNNAAAPCSSIHRWTSRFKPSICAHF